MNNRKPIGIFDSGVGGLTVLKEIIKELPRENTIYLGDTARVPYGIRSPEIVTKFSSENAEFLMSKKIKLLVVACNTSSSVSLSFLKKKLTIPVIGVVEPGAKAAVAKSKNKKIAVIGTETTIRSGSYEKAIKSINSSAEVIGVSCPLFVPLVEEGWVKGDIVTLIVKKYLSPLKNTGVDTLVLGCTHYPMIKDVIANAVNPVRKFTPFRGKSLTGFGQGLSNGVKITLIDSAVETAKEVRRILEERKLLLDKNMHPERKFFVTDTPQKFVKIGGKFLGQQISGVSKVDIGG